MHRRQPGTGLIWLAIFAAACIVAATARPAPLPDPPPWRTSNASAYSHQDSPGRMACTGRTVPDRGAYVAHKSLPCGTRVRICYRAQCVTARVADRGPYIRGRELDLTPGTYRALGATSARQWGVRKVRWTRL